MSKPIDYLERSRAQYQALGYPPYHWVHNDDPPPFARLTKPLSECRAGLVASGGIYVKGQVAFHFKDDTSYRQIPADVDYRDLRVTHFAYDLTDARADPNVVFPLQTLRGLAADGYLGEVGPHAYAFMGGIYSSRRVREELAPAIAERLQKDEVDLAILVPV
ncbi:MAG: glycine/sarcosine/betaine reductase selenoprotein B family protein [Pseudomonadales bacterium]